MMEDHDSSKNHIAKNVETRDDIINDAANGILDDLTFGTEIKGAKMMDDSRNDGQWSRLSNK